MNKCAIPNCNLKHTLLSGQTFGWDFDGEFYYGFTQNTAFKLKQVKDDIFWQTYPKKDDFEILQKYLNLKADYNLILQKISKDENIINAINKYPGLRILNQNFDETVLSFILSAFNNIKKIRNSIRLMNSKLGKKILVDNHEIFLFPETEIIANSDIDLLNKFKFGYRSKYIKSAAEFLIQNDLSKKIINLDLEDAREELKKITGVGEKIADCILCFSLNKNNVTPMDIWGKRVLVDLYKLHPKISHKEARLWVDEYFEGYGAWAGQFLFEYIRSKNKK